MSCKLQCPTCEQVFLSDEPDISMPCPACGVTLTEVDAPTPVVTTAPPPAETEPEPVAPEAGPTVDDRIVCPRCGLHFEHEGSRPPRPDTSRLTVLIVEHMEYFRDLARSALQDRFEIRTADNVEAARTELGSGDIDLLLLNPAVGGHHGNGIRFLEELPFKPCPILVYTDADESVLYGALWQRLQTLGADDVVVKGVNVGETVLRKVAALLHEPLDDHEAAAAS